jgi:putative phosphoserine phosphatase/1-acylglycerol-3-phosphate O-acyltransferase
LALALFDMDRTLIDVNSGHLWLRHEISAGRVGLKDAAWAVWWFGRYALGLGAGLDKAFDQAVAAYAGTPDVELRARSDAFFDAVVASRLRPGAERALQEHRAKGDRVALASSTTQYLADRACEAWGLDLAAFTELEVEDGIVTGRISSLALGRHKTTRTLEWAEAEGIDLSTATFYTDSATDADLMERVGSAVAVNPDRKLRRVAAERGWPIVDWGSNPG